MAIALDEDQQAIRDTARGYLREHIDFERLRRIVADGAGWDAALWHGFARELGFAGLGIPEDKGGIGLGPLEQAIILEELGRTLAPIPWFESVVLAGGILAEGMNGDTLLAEIARGEAIATLAARSADGGALPAAIGPQLDRGLLSGAAHFVPFGHVATHFVVAARDGTSVSLRVVSADAPGVAVERQTSLDLTRPYAIVRFDGVDAGPAIGDAVTLRRGLVRAAGLLASEQLGGAARSLEETVAYSRDRVQFGRTIGSFQAMKHRMADMKLLVDSARTAADWAARAIASGQDVERAAAGALAYCSHAYLTCAADAIQLHGGIGFTWEHHAHLFLKRARASATLLDPPAHHRETIARAILDPALEAV